MFYQILISILFIILIGVSIFSVGIYFPYLPKIWEYASLITSFFSLYSVIVMVTLSIISLIILKFHTTNLSIFIVILSLINLVAWSIPVISLYSLTNKYNISLSARDNLTLKINRWEIQTDKSIKYLSRDGNDLYLDYYPRYGTNNKKKAIAYVHGWGFTWGHRSEEPEMIEFFRQEWYSVFDIGYTLADEQNPSWDIAGREIQTALNWIGENADTYDADISELVIVGSSAGGTLALQSAYSWNNEFSWYNNLNFVKVKKIITLFPATDIETLWNRDTQFYGIKSRDTEYIWWTPSEFPERYKKVNTILLANEDSPETLIIHWLSDTLIPTDTVKALNSKLNVSGVKNTFVGIPYAAHWFTYFSGSYGFQISKWIMRDFLNKK